MSVKIRLRRMGAKKQPTYRVVVADEKKPRNGAFIENLGHYDPRSDPPTIVIDEARALHWLKVGAQPSDSVVKLFMRNKTMDKLARVKNGESIEQVMVPPAEATEQAS